MAVSTPDSISEFFKPFSREIWNSFDVYGLATFNVLRSVQVDYAFLHCAVQYWSSKDNVFRFCSNEICPLPEEFAAILGKNYHSSAPIAIPHLNLDFPNLMVPFFDLPTSTLLQCTIESKMIPSALLEQSKNKP